MSIKVRKLFLQLVVAMLLIHSGELFAQGKWVTLTTEECSAIQDVSCADLIANTAFCENAKYCTATCVMQAGFLVCPSLLEHRVKPESAPMVRSITGTALVGYDSFDFHTRLVSKFCAQWRVCSDACTNEAVPKCIGGQGPWLDEQNWGGIPQIRVTPNSQSCGSGI